MGVTIFSKIIRILTVFHQIPTQVNVYTGNFLGILVNRLVSEYKVPREKIVLIGHSLGGQISGWAGKKFGEISGQKLARIIALDPAGPLFILRPNSRRLNKHDAEVVMVIHTDGDKLGFPIPCGTIDFFPNGGDNQPGCWEVDLARISTYAEPGKSLDYDDFEGHFK